MIEGRQEINSMLVTMSDSEVELVKLFCRQIVDKKIDGHFLPVLMMLLAPETKLN